MIEVKTKLRKWGNSLGVVVPQKTTSGLELKEGEEIIILLKKQEENVLKENFGALKGWKIDSQKIKDNLRKEESEIEEKKWKQHTKRHIS